MSATKENKYKYIGHDYSTPDLLAKVRGQSKYAEDFRADGMVFAKLALSQVPHARIRRLDARKALAMPGSAGDPDPQTTCPWPEPGPEDPPPIGRPELALTNEPVYAGEPIFAIAAVDEHTAAEAVEAVEVDFEPLPFVIDPMDSLRPGGPNARARTATFTTRIRKSRLSSGPPRDFEEVAAGRLPWGAQAGEEAGYGDVDAAFKAADRNRRDGVPAVYLASRLEPRSVDGLLAERRATCSAPRKVWRRPWMRQRAGAEQVRPTGVRQRILRRRLRREESERRANMAIPAMLSKKVNRPVMMRISREEESSSDGCVRESRAGSRSGSARTAGSWGWTCFSSRRRAVRAARGCADRRHVRFAAYQPAAVRLRALSIATNTAPRDLAALSGRPQAVAICEPLVDKAARQAGPRSGADPEDQRTV